MYISGKSVQRISQIYNEQKKPVGKSGQGKRADKVTLSSEGRQLQAIIAKASAEVPSKKAEELKAAVSSGTYHVKGEDIAASIIKYYKQRM
ncbi:MAG: flagellar biosynthesis anti-sigma factor FlgM [Firmicutes bacterium]|nr:flagellar biosynthesis anti-sigma factor FlgM [Bacillota bacterium]NLL88002.1 flagellar biosynthesis anti-sigma factor FlgM [Bacillota bacterium]